MTPPQTNSCGKSYQAAKDSDRIFRWQVVVDLQVLGVQALLSHARDCREGLVAFNITIAISNNNYLTPAALLSHTICHRNSSFLNDISLK